MARRSNKKGRVRGGMMLRVRSKIEIGVEMGDVEKNNQTRIIGARARVTKNNYFS